MILRSSGSGVYGGRRARIELYGDRMLANLLRASRAVTLELEYNLLLCCTGTRWNGGRVIEDQTSRLEGGNEDTVPLCAQKELAVEMSNAVFAGKAD